jgi:hypothetical protein
LIAASPLQEVNMRFKVSFGGPGPSFFCRLLAAWVSSAGLFSILPDASAIEDVVIYECRKADAAPVIDGKLEDAAWQKVESSGLPYKFQAQVPVPAESRSTFKLCYDSQALYLGVVFFRDDQTPLKQNHRGRDDPDLWMDDSTEIYFDTKVDGKFHKFIVNSAGVVTDFQQTDRGIDYSWNANGAKVQASVDDSRWSVEMSVPWTDFGIQVPERQIWGFEILRFSGKHWASWTVGASYARPEKFGFITFGEGFFQELERLLTAASRPKGQHWRLVSRLGVVDFASQGVALDLAVAEAARKLGEARLNALNVPDASRREKILEKVQALQTNLDKLATRDAEPAKLRDEEFKTALHRLSGISTEAADLTYEALIEEMTAQGR